MALTLNGERTGAAGAQELAEFRAMLFEDGIREAMKQAEGKKDDFLRVREALKFLDPEGWSAWYDEHVPDWLGWMNAQPAIDVMMLRVREMMIGRDPFDGQDEADVDRFLEAIDGLHESSVAQMEAVQ